LAFNPVLPNINENINQHGRQNISRDEYMKYSWLFGGR
jgi:hypothetical protein